MKRLRHLYGILVGLTLVLASGCDSTQDASATSLNPPASVSDPSRNSGNPGSPSGSVGDLRRTYETDAMLFTGSGTWSTEVNNLRTILTSNRARFRELNSAQLNAMSVEDIARFGVLIFPGGSGGTQAGSLTSQTKANLREAVQKRGVSYIGFCAGAFIAEAPAPAPGRDVAYGLGIVDGPILDYYYLENRGVSVAMTLARFPDGSTRDILWYGGPVTPEIPGGVVARYPDGSPMVTQVWSGSGFVIMVATHPTANEATLSALGVRSSDGVHQDFAWDLIRAALHQQPMPVF